MKADIWQFVVLDDKKLPMKYKKVFVGSSPTIKEAESFLEKSIKDKRLNIRDSFFVVQTARGMEIIEMKDNKEDK